MTHTKIKFSLEPWNFYVHKANINLTLGMADTYPSKSYIFDNYRHLLNSFRIIIQNANRGTTSDVKKKVMKLIATAKQPKAIT